MSIAVETAIAGKRVLWAAPTYDQVRICWGETKHAAALQADFNMARMTATFSSGGTILYRSLDNPDNVRGHTANGIVIDECAVVREEAWYEVLRPMLIDTGGWAWFIGTPKGLNWFYREHTDAHDREDSISWQVPTLGVAIGPNGLERNPHPLENPNISFPEIVNLRQTMPEQTFEQEILAAFLDIGGGVFRRVMDAATATEVEPQPGHEYVVGVDWGKHADFTVLCVLDAATCEMVALDRFNQIDYAVQVGRLKALCERYRPGTVIAERNSMGEPLVEQLMREGLPVTPFNTTQATKAAAIDALALAFERSEIHILNDPVLINELQAYEMERLPSGLMRYNAPSGMHDDCVIALALAWQGCARPPAIGTMVDLSVDVYRPERRSILWRR